MVENEVENWASLEFIVLELAAERELHPHSISLKKRVKYLQPPKFGENDFEFFTCTIKHYLQT